MHDGLRRVGFRESIQLELKVSHETLVMRTQYATASPYHDSVQAPGQVARSSACQLGPQIRATIDLNWLFYKAHLVAADIPAYAADILDPPIELHISMECNLAIRPCSFLIVQGHFY